MKIHGFTENSTVAPVMGVVSGSGIDLGDLFDLVDNEISFDAIPGLTGSSVPGHPGRFLSGLVLGRRVILQQGRKHVYEGLSFEEIVHPVTLLYEMGCRELILCNAVGGLDPVWQPADLVAVTRCCPWFTTRIELPEVAHTDFLVAGCCGEGTYLWVSGPSYETQAEIKAMRKLGYAVVGMSTLPEMYHAQNLGMRVGVISCVTNSCLATEPLTHDHVLETAHTSSAKICSVIRKHLEKLIADMP